MGVPSFFRWLVKKYPKIVTDAIELHTDDATPDTTRTDIYDASTVDITQPNPNGFETDNLYLDMNGIIHPCTHPEDGAQPLTEDDMMYTIFRYIDRIFNIVRPRKLLYMAIDGVAPRAKMNQQRQRRFRAAREIYDKQQIESKLRSEWAAAGRTLPPPSKQVWDSNVITPGTPFMDRLAAALRYYVQLRVSTHPAWRHVKVMFTDANVPGEGEHKIMRYIRLQRAQPGYDANTSHMLYGMDADLIMLGLASHDPHFRIIREVVTESAPTPKCAMCGRAHWTSDCTGEEPLADGAEEVDHSKPASDDRDVKHTIFGKPFQFLHINVLREYLSFDLYVEPTTLPWCNGVFDIERAIDDFVFLCFFVGNDFLPHLPTLEIREGAIDALVFCYKKYLPQMGGYITDSGHVDLKRASMVMVDISHLEDEIFRRRRAKQQRQDQQRDEAVQRVERIRADNKAREAADKKFASTADDKFLAVLGKKNVNAGTTAITSSGPQANAVAAAKLKALLAKHSGEKRSTDDVATTNGSVSNTGDNTSNGNTVPALTNGAPAAPAPYQFKHIKMVSAEHAAKKAKTDDGPVATAATPSPQPAAESTAEPSTHAAATNTAPLASSSPAPSTDNSANGDHTEAELVTKAEPSAVKSVDDSDESDKDEVEKHLLPDIEIKAKQELDYAKEFKQMMKPLNEPSAVPDTIQFGEMGWKQRYYASKLHVDPNSGDGQKQLDNMFQSYACGLAWVLLYYYEGCASWSWYYPYHYSPMASNLTDLEKFQPIQFMQSKPFKPFDQLLGVLPSASAHALPTEYARLMTEKDSPLADQYPIDFELDLNGKKWAWQAIALLPWIDETKLLTEARKKEPTLLPDEQRRNRAGDELVYAHESSPLGQQLKRMYDTVKHSSGDTDAITEPLDYNAVGISGEVATYTNAPLPGQTVSCDIHVHGIELPVLSEDNHCISGVYTLPPFKAHKPDLLPGLILPETVLTSTDLDDQERGGRKAFLLTLLQPHNNNGGGRYNQYEQPWQSRPAQGGNGVYNTPYQASNGGGGAVKTQMCHQFQRGQCNRGDSCKFSHVPLQPAQPPQQQYNNYQQPPGQYGQYGGYQQSAAAPYNQYQQNNGYNAQPPQQQYGYGAQQPLMQYAQQTQQPQAYAQQQPAYGNHLYGAYSQPTPPAQYQQYTQQQYGYGQPVPNAAQSQYNMLPSSSPAPTQPPQQQPYSFAHPNYRR